MKAEDEDPYASPEAQARLREERGAQHRELSQISASNRFRLMFGLPLLPEIINPVTMASASLQGFVKAVQTVDSNP